MTKEEKLQIYVGSTKAFEHIAILKIELYKNGIATVNLSNIILGFVLKCLINLNLVLIHT